jgi:hypothetical protein
MLKLFLIDLVLKLKLFLKVDKYEEALNQFKVNCDKIQQQYRDCHCALMQAEQQVKC